MESDERLWERLRAGELAAFDQLYARYERPLYGFILGFLGDGAEAEDVFHEAFLAMLRDPPPASLSVRGWLYQTARNMCLNRLRSRRRGDRAAERLGAEPTPPEPRPDDKLEARAAEEALAGALARLPPLLSEVFHLRSSGLSYQEMAEALAIPLGTVKSRMHELVTQLRKELRPWTAS